MRLDPEVRKQVEERLKRRVPEPDEPEFYQLLEELRVQDPEVAALLEEGIQFEQVKPPEEEVKVPRLRSGPCCGTWPTGSSAGTTS
jgi:hypothetical protein